MRKPLLAWAVLVLAVAAGAARAQAPAPSWPPVQRQLAADRVVVGSPLQSLIESNQDFALLRPGEARDKIPVPLWLRVLWRKGHPDSLYAADDPTGGYPLALKEIHEWLVSHQDLLPGLPEPAGLEEPWLPESAGIGRADRRISGPVSHPRSESDIRVFPGDPTRVIAASNNIGGSGAQAQYASKDGGASWTQSELPLIGRDSFQTDPTVDWTSDGTAWATTIGVTWDESALRLRLYKSTDGGTTWSLDSTFSGNQISTDKQMAWIDHSAASPYRDSIYAIWHNEEPVFMNRRQNGVWGSPVRVSGAETRGTGIGGDVKTNSAGVVFGFWPDTGGSRIWLVRSTDGGGSYTKPVAVAATWASYDIGVPAQNSRRALIYVSGGAFRAANRNLAYAAWTDLSGAAGCATGADEPRSNAASACKSRIWFARSTDGGVTWGPKKMINNQAGKNDQFNQALAVDETTGAVAVVYYDTVGDPERKKTGVWYQSSFDDGVTWSAPFLVTTAPTVEAGGGADLGNQYGDYNSLTGYAGTFFPVWTDRRGGRSEEIWTAAVADSPLCTPPAAPGGVGAAAVGPHRIRLSWQPVAGAVEYRVYRATTSGGPYRQIAAVTAPATLYPSVGLTAGTRYYYVIRAWARCESPGSAEVSMVSKGAVQP